MTECCEQLALEGLYSDVVASFACDELKVDQPFGWRAVAQQVMGPRIVWVPGEPRSGNAGTLGPAQLPGRLPRPLATFLERFHVVISNGAALDEKELAQYRAARLLFDAWYRAAWRVARQQLTVESTQWVTTAGVNSSLPRQERRHGAAMIVICTLEASIPDKLRVIEVPSAHAPFTPRFNIDVLELDVAESISLAPRPVVDGSLRVASGGSEVVDDDDA